MPAQRDLIASALETALMRGQPRPGHSPTRAEWETVDALIDEGVVSIRVGDAEGCGFWLPIDGAPIEAAPDEWWSCVIPDAEHRGRDCVLVRRKRLESPS